MDRENIVTLFEGLTEEQARQFRRELMPALRSLREQIVQAEPTNKENQTMNGWKGSFIEIARARAQYNKDYQVMTDYERMANLRHITERQHVVEQSIIAGTLAEVRAADAVVNDAFRAVQEAKAAETRRWDGTKLAGEMAVYGELVKRAVLAAGGPGPEASAAVKVIYDDARQSGDQHKARAAAEVITGLEHQFKTGSMDVDLPMVTLSKAAQQDLKAIRRIPQMDAAEVKRLEAQKAVGAAIVLVKEVDAGLGYTHFNGTLGDSRLAQAIYPYDKSLAGLVSLPIERQPKAAEHMTNPEKPEATGEQGRNRLEGAL